MQKTFLSIITVTYNSEEVIKNYLKEVKKIKEAEVIIVDNNSQDKTKKILEKEKVKKIFLKRNYGYAKANNIGFKYSQGEVILLLNPDAFPYSLDLEELKRLIKVYPIIAPLILRDKNNIETSVREFPSLLGFIFPFLWKKRINYQKRQFVSQPMFSAIFIKREVFEKLGGFDERFFIYFTDVEFMERARRKNIKPILVPEIIFFHNPGKSCKRNKKIMALRYLDWARGASKYFYFYKNPIEKFLTIPLIWLFSIFRYFYILFI
ncbi:MAG: glycosyltransferase family 2 protein [candidate division WOR-3 bacterium]|nr:glycosyltransferase family 2 protein [candidate division WOR-3 bacterium]MCX7836901.1 glycosyltransferase family 2 protein [candidate division WOR-3 bacterium]MDW8114621.1 glycosyltransferase family 2 protein [candidate division WOR-3 bacterium]